VNCQAEAQYAFRMNKKIIPLIMQPGYETVQGWLGIILGDKIYVNFEEFDFDVCIQKILHEIKNSSKSNSASSNNQVYPQIIVNNSTMSNSKTIKIENWSEEQVKDWFMEKNLNMKIFDAFAPLNGDLLFQIYEMKKCSPEFYYQSLNRIVDDMRSILNFSLNINKLFSDL
jgi:hypothetical protein